MQLVILGKKDTEIIECSEHKNSCPSHPYISTYVQKKAFSFLYGLATTVTYL